LPPDRGTSRGCRPRAVAPRDRLRGVSVSRTSPCGK